MTHVTDVILLARPEQKKLKMRRIRLSFGRGRLERPWLMEGLKLKIRSKCSQVRSNKIFNMFIKVFRDYVCFWSVLCICCSFDLCCYSEYRHSTLLVTSYNVFLNSANLLGMQDPLIMQDNF